MVLQVHCPEIVFIELLKPLQTGDAKDLEWIEEGKTLKPTAIKKTFCAYNYTIRKPSLIDKIWRLELMDKKRRRSRKNGEEMLPWRRGHGCARLHLSQAAARRGEKTNLISQVTGNVIMNLKVPKNERAMPQLTMKYSVATMDKNGHVIWPTKYEVRTAAALRKQMRFHLEEMIRDAEYPTLEHMAGSLHGAGSDAVLALRCALMLPLLPRSPDSAHLSRYIR